MSITSRNYYKNPYTLEVDSVSLFGNLVIGASGAVTSFSGGGIKSITKETADGQYTIELTDKFARMLGFNAVGVDDAVLAFGQVQIFEAALQTDVKADSKFKIQLLDFAGAAVNATSGCQLMFEIKMRQSSIGRYDA